MKHLFPPVGKKYITRTADRIGKKGVQSLADVAGRKVGQFLGNKLGPAAPLGNILGDEVGKGLNEAGQYALRSADNHIGNKLGMI